MPLPFCISSFFEKVTAILSGFVKVVLMCITLNFSFSPFPFNICFSFHCCQSQHAALEPLSWSWLVNLLMLSLFNKYINCKQWIENKTKKKKKTISEWTVSYFVLHLTVLLTAQFLKPGSYGNAFTPLALLLEIAYCFICLFILVHS